MTTGNPGRLLDLGRTLGSLTVDDIGSRVTFKDAGATYNAVLDQVQHSVGFTGKRQTLVILKEGDWSHVKTHDADTPCTTPTAPPHAAGEGEPS